MMRATLDALEAPFLSTMLDVRGVPEAERPGHRFTLEAADALITVQRTASGWSLDAVEEVAP